jgi:predicted phage tail protein
MSIRRTQKDVGVVAIPIVIFVVCISAGVFAGSRWLPDLAGGTIGGLAFFVVCGLLGASLGVAGLQIYSIVRQQELLGRLGSSAIVADGLSAILWQAGSLLGLAAVVYLLAPRAQTPEERAAGPVA